MGKRPATEGPALSGEKEGATIRKSAAKSGEWVDPPQQSSELCKPALTGRLHPPGEQAFKTEPHRAVTALSGPTPIAPSTPEPWRLPASPASAKTFERRCEDGVGGYWDTPAISHSRSATHLRRKCHSVNPGVSL